MISPERLRTAVLAATLLLVAAFVWAPAASAHDLLIGSTPANGDTVARLPTSVELDFEEPPVAGYTKATVTAPDGTSVSKPLISNGSKVVVPLRATKARGSFRITYSILSDDGHVVAGVITFHVGGAAASQPAAAAKQHKSSSNALGLIALGAVLLGALALVMTRRSPRRANPSPAVESAGVRL